MTANSTLAQNAVMVLSERSAALLQSLSGYVVLSEGRTSTDTDIVFAIGKVALYFILVLLTWGQSLADIVRVGRPRYPLLTALLFAFGLYNVVEAWRLIYEWLNLEIRAAQLVAGQSFAWEDWLVNIELFRKAYEMVIATPFQWFWSSQLLVFVPSMVVFTYVEFHRSRAVRPLSNFWLGCFAAISLCFPYVMCVALNTPPEVRRQRLHIPTSWLLIFGVVGANLAAVLLPIVEAAYFGHVLAFLHASLCLPLFAAQFLAPVMFPPPRSSMDQLLGSWWIVILYSVLGGMAAMVQLFNLLAAVSSYSGDVLLAFYNAFCANPSQCSISNDVVRTTGVFALVVLWAGGQHWMGALRLRTRLLLVAASPVLGIGVTFPLWAAIRELHLRLQPFTYPERLYRLRLKYDPLNAQTLNHWIAALKRYPRREDEILRHFLRKYGSEPREETVVLEAARTELVNQRKKNAAATVPKKVRTEAEVAQLKAKLADFYKFHNPEKLAQLDAIAAAWADRDEEVLFNALRKKYGENSMPPSPALRSFTPQPADAGGALPPPFGLGDNPLGEEG